MRLVDADVLLEELRKSRKWHAENGRELELLVRCENIVDEQPTAYDVEKVVEELRSNTFDMSLENPDCKAIWIEKAIEIVKRGGTDDGS